MSNRLLHNQPRHLVGQKSFQRPRSHISLFVNNFGTQPIERVNEHISVNCRVPLGRGDDILKFERWLPEGTGEEEIDASFRAAGAVVRKNFAAGDRLRLNSLRCSTTSIRNENNMRNARLPGKYHAPVDVDSCLT